MATANAKRAQRQGNERHPRDVGQRLGERGDGHGRAPSDVRQERSSSSSTGAHSSMDATVIGSRTSWTWLTPTSAYRSDGVGQLLGGPLERRRGRGDFAAGRAPSAAGQLDEDRHRALHLCRIATGRPCRVVDRGVERCQAVRRVAEPVMPRVPRIDVRRGEAAAAARRSIRASTAGPLGRGPRGSSSQSRAE